MDVSINSKGKDMIRVEIEGVRHTLPNLLCTELWNDSSVSSATYEKKHPYMGNSILIIKSKDPKKSLKDAINRTEKSIGEFEKKFKAACS